LVESQQEQKYAAVGYFQHQFLFGGSFQPTKHTVVLLQSL
jgi:hypothetical protein